MSDKENEIKELKERLNKLENSQDLNEKKIKKKKKSGCLSKLFEYLLIIALIVGFVAWLTSGDSDVENETTKIQTQEIQKVDKNDEVRAIITASLQKQNFYAYWSQGSSLWIENPGYSKLELEKVGYNLCDTTKNSGYRESYIITFWQSLKNGPNGQIVKVKCF